MRLKIKVLKLLPHLQGPISRRRGRLLWRLLSAWTRYPHYVGTRCFVFYECLITTESPGYPIRDDSISLLFCETSMFWFDDTCMESLQIAFNIHSYPMIIQHARVCPKCPLFRILYSKVACFHPVKTLGKSIRWLVWQFLNMWYSFRISKSSNHGICFSLYLFLRGFKGCVCPYSSWSLHWW